MDHVSRETSPRCAADGTEDARYTNVGHPSRRSRCKARGSMEASEVTREVLRDRSGSPAHEDTTEPVRAPPACPAVDANVRNAGCRDISRARRCSEPRQDPSSWPNGTRRQSSITSDHLTQGTIRSGRKIAAGPICKPGRSCCWRGQPSCSRRRAHPSMGEQQSRDLLHDRAVRADGSLVRRTPPSPRLPAP